MDTNALPIGRRSLVDRIVGVLRLDEPTYGEIERDTEATSQALIVVILAAIAAGIGRLGGDYPVRGFVGGIVSGVIGWVVFSAVVYVVGKALFASDTSRVTLGRVLRVMGFAQAPNLLLVLGFVPAIGGIVSLVAAIWGILTGITALRVAFDFSTLRAVATAIVAAIAVAIVLSIVFLLIFGSVALLVGAGR